MNAEREDRLPLAAAKLRRALRRWRTPAVLWPQDELALPLATLLADVWPAGAAWRVLCRPRRPEAASPEALRSQLGAMWRIARIDLAEGAAALAAACLTAGIDGVIAAEPAPGPPLPEWLEPLAGWDAPALRALVDGAAARAGADPALTGVVIDRLKFLGYL